MQAVEANDDDSIIDVWSSSACTFTVEGNPSPQRRYDIGWTGKAFDPSKKKKLTFRSNIKVKLSLSDDQQPLFPKHTFLSMTVLFRMRRPNNHFVGNKRECLTLKSDAPSPLLVAKKCDVDNLLKFVMDAATNVLYEDDTQVAAVHAFRLYDSEDACEGSTTVRLEPVSNVFPSCHSIVL